GTFGVWRFRDSRTSVEIPILVERERVSCCDKAAPPAVNLVVDTPEWRNGRRSGLKIRRWQHREGSNPSSGTQRRERKPGRIVCPGFCAPRPLRYHSGQR